MDNKIVAANTDCDVTLGSSVFNNLVDAMNKNIKNLIESVRTDSYTPLVGRILPKGGTVKDNNLWRLFIDNIHESIRQRYNCNTCKKFIREWGDLVIIDTNNFIYSLLWNEEIVPDRFKESVKAMREACENGRVLLNDFYINHRIPKDMSGYSNNIIGKISRCEEEYNHLHISKDSLKGINLSLTYTEYLNSILTLLKLSQCDSGHIDRYVSIINSDILIGVEKYRWTTSIKDFIREFHTNKTNIVPLCIKYASIADWRWNGFRGSVVGQTFDSCCEGASDESIIRQYEYLTDPTKYMRPTSTPSDQLINQANRMFEEYGITADSLRRRPARVDELTYIWRDSYVEEPPMSVHGIDKSGVFDSLLSSNTKKKTIMPSKHKMSMNKFLYKILPDCDKVSILISNWGANRDFNLSNRGVWFLTSTVPDAAPILRWDKVDSRQPVSQFQLSSAINPYLYIPESYLEAGSIEVCGICYDSLYWNSDINPETMSGSGINFVFDNGKLPIDKYLGLFPEIIDSKFYSVRKVIEVYSQNNYLDSITPEGASPACGIRFYHSDKISLTLRVHHKHNGWMDISITIYEAE